MAYSDRFRTEDLQCRCSEAKYWATTSIGWSLISRCLIRARQCGVLSAPRRWAMLEGKHDVSADQRVDQFVRLRDAIEERASSGLSRPIGRRRSTTGHLLLLLG